MAEHQGKSNTLALQQGRNGSSWLRDSWEFRAQSYVYVGERIGNPRIGVIHTIPAEGRELFPGTLCVSSTKNEDEPLVVVTSNLGYIANEGPIVVNMGRQPQEEDGEPAVSDELKGVTMLDYGYLYSFPALLDAHEERLEALDRKFSDLSTEEIMGIYSTLLYESPRYAH